MTAQATAVNVTGTAQIATGQGTLRGLSVFSTAGATITVYDNIASSGTVLAKFILAANGDKHLDFGDGVRFGTGLRFDAGAGAVEGSVRIG